MKSFSGLLIDAVQTREARVRQAKVTAIAAGPPRTITVEIDGTTYPNIQCGDYVDPLVNEGVWLLDTGLGSMFAFATIRSTATRPRYVRADGDTMTGTLGVTDISGPAASLTTAGKLVNLTTAPRAPVTSGAVGTGSANFGLEIYQANVNADAFVAFHVANDFAAMFGIDGTMQDLFVGGWSFGATKYRVNHAGNGFRVVSFGTAFNNAGGAALTTTPAVIANTTVSFSNVVNGDWFILLGAWDFQIVGSTDTALGRFDLASVGSFGPQAIKAGSGTRGTVSQVTAYQAVSGAGTYSFRLTGSRNSNAGGGTINVLDHTSLVGVHLSKA